MARYVARMEPDRFVRETHAVLARFCQAVARSERVEAELVAVSESELKTDDGLRRFNTLSRCAQHEAATIQSLATAMRITHKSRYDVQKAGVHTRAGAARSGKPWGGS